MGQIRGSGGKAASASGLAEPSEDLLDVQDGEHRHRRDRHLGSTPDGVRDRLLHHPMQIGGADPAAQTYYSERHLQHARKVYAGSGPLLNGLEVRPCLRKSACSFIELGFELRPLRQDVITDLVQGW